MNAHTTTATQTATPDMPRNYRIAYEAGAACARLGLDLRDDLRDPSNGLTDDERHAAIHAAYNHADWVFFDLGFVGKPMPEYVTGWRVGALPEEIDGRSYDYYEDGYEDGTALIDCDGKPNHITGWRVGALPDAIDGRSYDYYEDGWREWLTDSERAQLVRVGGWYIGRTYYGTHLVLGAHVLGEQSI